jgi:hypothetical protein
MYHLLIKLMVLSALLQLGISVSEVGDCKDRKCVPRIEKGSRDILKINWRPISIFPEEAKRFR